MSLRKIVFIFFGIIVFQFVILALMPWPDHAYYQESDRYSYCFYTDIDIKMLQEFLVVIFFHLIHHVMSKKV